MLLAIDPGQTTGWALFVGNVLVACGLATAETAHIYASKAEVNRVVIERPMIYPGGRTKNPNDVLKVAVNAGEWGGRFLDKAIVEYVTPSGWKGQTPKEIQHERQWDRLSLTEQLVVATAGRGMAASKRHNMLDAVGIGLWAVGRGK